MEKFRKKIIALSLALSSILCICMTGCSTNSSKSENSEGPAVQSQPIETPTPTPTQMPSTAPSASAEVENVSPYEIFAYDLPTGYKKPNERAGEVHEEHYTTYTYNEKGERGPEIEGTMYVYTPYGYDPAKQYNILYLMHGGGETEGFWLGAGEYAPGGPRYNKAQANTAVKIIDNMIANGDCEDVIVVASTFRNNDGGVNKANYNFELKNDIIPMVETKYSTYAGGDVSTESLVASREHRAFTGFSAGVWVTVSAVWDNCFQYFAYIGTLSGWDQEGLDSVMEKMREGGEYANYALKYWYVGNGTEDLAHDGVEQYKQVLESAGDLFREGEGYVSGDNCILVDKPGKQHNYANWNVDLYNILKVFFKVP